MRDQTLQWKDIQWLKSITKLPIILKGILRPSDALKANISALMHESRIIRYCWDVFKVSTVFLSGLLVSPLLLFSAQILA